jgi:hypothetical protein
MEFYFGETSSLLLIFFDTALAYGRYWLFYMIDAMARDRRNLYLSYFLMLFGVPNESRFIVSAQLSLTKTPLHF